MSIIEAVLNHVFSVRSEEDNQSSTEYHQLSENTEPGLRTAIRCCGTFLDELAEAQILYQTDSERYQEYERRIEGVLMLRDRLMEQL